MIERNIVNQLPAEIWIMIFEHLSYDGFPANASHLTVYKKWYFLGRAVFSRRLTLTPNQLARLMTFGDYPVPQARCARLLHEMKALTIHVPPYVYPFMEPA